MENNAFLPGSASLVESVDKRLLVSLRDGRYLYGWLRSYDQFANLVLQDTVERIYFVHDKKYSELPHGVFLIRGENVVFLGESDIESENQLLSSWTKIDFKEAKAIVKNESESKQKIKNAQVKILHSKGFSEDLIQY